MTILATIAVSGIIIMLSADERKAAKEIQKAST